MTSRNEGRCEPITDIVYLSPLLFLSKRTCEHMHRGGVAVAHSRSGLEQGNENRPALPKAFPMTGSIA